MRPDEVTVTIELEPMPDQPWRKDVWAVYAESAGQPRRCVGRFTDEDEARSSAAELSATPAG